MKLADGTSPGTERIPSELLAPRRFDADVANAHLERAVLLVRALERMIDSKAYMTARDQATMVQVRAFLAEVG